MKAKTYLSLLVGVAFGYSVQAEISKLEAISMIETGNNDRAVGQLGEISRYQIMPKVWRQYTQSRSYRNVTISSQIAAQHLDFLETNFRKQAEREPSDFELYVLWNAGLTYYKSKGFNPNRVARSIRERANRFANLRQKHHEEMRLAYRQNWLAWAAQRNFQVHN